MDIAKAKQLTPGASVYCPADRGSPAFTGKIVSVGTDEHKTLSGTPFVWVAIDGVHRSVWPSNRLG